MSDMKTIPYEYRNLPIPGGGYVTGFVFHKNKPGVLYCRTDIGGTYRYDYDNRVWKSLIDHVNMHELDETFPAAVALIQTGLNAFLLQAGRMKKIKTMVCFRSLMIMGLISRRK